MIFLNPPRGARGRSRKGRFVKLAPRGFSVRRNPRRKRRKKTMAKRRKRRKARGGRTATGRFKKGHRSGGRRRKSRGGRRRKSSGRRRASRRAPRRRARRRGLRRSGWTHHKVNVWSKGSGRRRRYRQGSRRGLLRGHRVNPPLIPSLGSVKGIVRQGAFATVGWVGVNAVGMLLSRFNVLGFLAGKSPMVQALAGTAVRVLSVPLVAYVGGMVVKNGSDRQAMVLGASANAIFHGIRDVGAASGQMPSWADGLLLGSDGPGFADYLTMNDYVQGFDGNGQPFQTSNLNPMVQAEGAFI